MLPLATRRSGRRVYSTEVLLPAGAAGQPHDSIVMAHQMRMISTRCLGEACGELTDPALRDAVRRALRVCLDLD